MLFDFVWDDDFDRDPDLDKTLGDRVGPSLDALTQCTSLGSGAMTRTETAKRSRSRKPSACRPGSKRRSCPTRT